VGEQRGSRVTGRDRCFLRAASADPLCYLRCEDVKVQSELRMTAAPSTAALRRSLVSDSSGGAIGIVNVER